MVKLNLEQNELKKSLIFNLGMVRGTNTMWLLMAPDGQVFARGLRTAAGVLKGKLHTLAVGKQTLNRISWKLKWWT